MDDFQFYFIGDDEHVLSLEVEDSGFGIDGWWIEPSSPPPEIPRKEIDGIGAASTPYDPAHCDLLVQWTDKTATPQLLSNRIKMNGISKRSFLLLLDFEDQNSKSTSTSVQPTDFCTPTQKVGAIGNSPIGSLIPEFPKMNDRPTMLQLQSLERKDGREPVRIMMRIGTQYQELAIYLLDDDNGELLNTIKKDAHGDTKAVCHKIFSDWLAGKGKEITWKTLVYALREQSQLKTLADDIVTALQTYAEPH